jgi:hypothetical protein
MTCRLATFGGRAEREMRKKERFNEWQLTGARKKKKKKK